jgi:hypothetical protein
VSLTFHAALLYYLLSDYSSGYSAPVNIGAISDTVYRSGSVDSYITCSEAEAIKCSAQISSS